MKPLIKSLLLSGALLSAAAAPTSGQTTPPATISDLGAMTPDQVVARLDANLHLSDEQKIQITPIIVDRRQKLEALQAASFTFPMRKARKMKSIFKESDKKIEALLDDQQKKKYEALREQLRQQIHQQMRGNSVGTDGGM